MTIRKSDLPKQSKLNIEHKTYDFVDSFEGVLTDEKNTIDGQKVGRAFFTSSPKWVDKLFVLRNKIVSVLGLKTSGDTTDRQTSHRLLRFRQLVLRQVVQLTF